MRYNSATSAAGGFPAELRFGEKLIGYEEHHQARMLVVKTQAALLKLGYEVGDVDGKLGSRTRSAIKKFPKSQQITVDGKPSPALLNTLNEALGSAGSSAAGRSGHASEQ